MYEFAIYEYRRGRHVKCSCGRQIADGEFVMVTKMSVLRDGKRWFVQKLEHFDCGVERVRRDLLRQCGGRPPKDLVPERRRGRPTTPVIYIKRKPGDTRKAVDLTGKRVRPVGKNRYVVEEGEVAKGRRSQG